MAIALARDAPWVPTSRYSVGVYEPLLAAAQFVGEAITEINAGNPAIGDHQRFGCSRAADDTWHVFHTARSFGERRDGHIGSLDHKAHHGVRDSALDL